MASLEKRGERFRIKFRYGGRQFGVALKTSDQKEAGDLLGKLEYNLTLAERGHLPIPASADVGRFLLSDGRLTGKAEVAAPLGLSDFFQRYQDRQTTSKEVNTCRIERVHMRHLERLLGSRLNVRAVTTQTLQGYVDARGREQGLNGLVSHVTIRKEIGTFGSIWNLWAVPVGLLSGPAPTKGLIYRKDKEKPPFQTWEQIERSINRDGLTKAEQDDLWDSLYLSLPQIQDVLSHVKTHATSPWVHPAMAMAAYTGARRGEILRSRVEDLDFDGQTVRLREKKRDRSKAFTFRHVPLTPALATILRRWMAAHPGGQFTFCDEPGVAISDGLARHYLEQALVGSKWNVLRGWHVFRHSFISNCAAKGVDQRIIDTWSGHQTEAMRRRYTHLFPTVQQKAIKSVFGGK